MNTTENRIAGVDRAGVSAIAIGQPVKTIYEAEFVKGPVQGMWRRSSRTFPLAIGVG